MIHTSSLLDNWSILLPLNVCGDSPIPLDTFLVNYYTPGGTYYSSGNFYNYPPGQRYEYSNAGVNLLALIIENLTGKSFDEYCRDSIFTPLSMNTASWYLEGMNINNIATPYYNYLSPICHKGWPLYPSVFLRANKIEMSNFLLAYLNNGVYNNYRILDSATIAYMLSDQLGYNLYDGSVTQGLIWFRLLSFNGSVWGHNGEWNGAESYIGLDPKEKFGVIWFQNWSEVATPYLKLLGINFYFTRYAYLYGNIYALGPEVDKRYARIGIDDVLFRTEFSNRYNHQFNANLIYTNSDGTILDSMALFDDGLHGDSLSNDGIYGAYIPPQQDEDFYSLGVSTIDNQTNKYLYTSDICRFTTAGPVVLDSISCIKASTYYQVKPFVRNQSTNTTISNAFVSLKCDDPWVQSIFPEVRYLPNIPPGGVVSNPAFFNVQQIDSLFPVPGHFNFKVEVMIDGWTYWKDSVQVIVGVEEEFNEIPKEYLLSQNYPNPFNPSTTIRYSIAEPGKVKLTLYNLLGEAVATLVNEEKLTGDYSIEINAANLPSGVYFYRIKAGDYTSVKKMILLK